VVDVGMRADHGIDVLWLDAGFSHALLLPAGGGPERLGGAHAGIEEDELVAGVHDRRVLFEHDIVRGEEVVGEHLLHFLLGNAGEGAGGITKGQGPVGHDGHFGIAENEAMPVGSLGAELGSACHRAVAEHGTGAKAGSECEQGSA